MQCPNCGNTVRSKTQCAFCGYRFNSADKQELNQTKTDNSQENRSSRRAAGTSDGGEIPRRSRQEDKGKKEAAYQPKPIPRRNLDQELETAEQEARDAYASASNAGTTGPVRRSFVLENKASQAEKSDEVDEDFKKRADEVLSYPYTPVEEDIDYQTRSTYQEEYADESVVPKTKTKTSKNIVGTIFKVVIAFALIFLLFLFAPRIIGQVMQYFGSSDSSQSQEPFNLPDINLPWEQDDDGEGSAEQEDPIGNDPAADEENTPSSAEEENNAASQTSVAVNDATSEEAATSEAEDTREAQEDTETTGEEEETNQAIAAYSLVDSNVILEDYPTVTVEMEFDRDLLEVDRDTFDFTVQYNETEVTFDNEYSLLKEGNTLILSFVDPAIAVVGEDTSNQTLLIEAEDFEQEIEYSVPSDNLDQAQADEFNTIINEGLNEVTDVSVVLQSTENESAYIYDNQTVEADTLISWFILQKTYQLVEEGDLSLDDTIEVFDQLIASGDAGVIAAADEGQEFTLQQMIDLIIQQGDASAMNHLVQATGGVNEFNYWLNGNQYFATRMNAPLAVEDDYISGAVTNGTDVSRLLVELAADELVSTDLDESFKESLLQSPITQKFPANTLVTRRYELITDDENSHVQHYAGIVETDDTTQVIVILTSNFSERDQVINNISTMIDQSLTYMVTGQTVSEQEEAASAQAETASIEEASRRAEAESRAQEQAEAESRSLEESRSLAEQTRPADETVEQPDTAATSPSGEPTTNLYEGLETQNSYWFEGEYRPGIWFQTEDGQWMYR